METEPAPSTSPPKPLLDSPVSNCPSSLWPPDQSPFSGIPTQPPLPPFDPTPPEPVPLPLDKENPQFLIDAVFTDPNPGPILSSLLDLGPQHLAVLCPAVSRALTPPPDPIPATILCHLVSRLCERDGDPTCGKLLQVGIPKVLIANLNKRNRDIKLQTAGISALLSMTMYEQARAIIVAGKGAEAVVWAMMEMQDQRDILTAGATCLCNLAFGCEESKRRIGKIGGLDAVVSAMLQYPDDVDLQTRCCLAVRNLTCGIRANQWIAGRSCALEAVVSAMSRFEKNVTLQYQGAVAIANICEDESDNRLRATEIGVIDIVFRAIRVNITNANLVEHCLSAIKNVTVKNHENQMQVGDQNGLQLLLKCLSSHRSNDKVIVSACQALRYVLFSRSNRRLALKVGMLEELIRVMRDFLPDAIVVEAALSALANAICDLSESKRLIARYGGIATLIDLMHNHLDSRIIQQHACRAMRNLADSDELTIRLLVECRSIETVIFAMMAYPDDDTIHQHACAMLFNIGFKDEYLRRMYELDLESVIQETQTRFPENVGLQMQSNGLLVQLRAPLEQFASRGNGMSRSAAARNAVARSAFTAKESRVTSWLRSQESSQPLSFSLLKLQGSRMTIKPSRKSGGQDT